MANTGQPVPGRNSHRNPPHQKTVNHIDEDKGKRIQIHHALHTVPVNPPAQKPHEEDADKADGFHKQRHGIGLLAEQINNYPRAEHNGDLFLYAMQHGDHIEITVLLAKQQFPAFFMRHRKRGRLLLDQKDRGNECNQKRTRTEQEYILDVPGKREHIKTETQKHNQPGEKTHRRFSHWRTVQFAFPPAPVRQCSCRWNR